jgi:8-oxo-dGTP pyrophosphatase MutT (NUDIX family)
MVRRGGSKERVFALEGMPGDFVRTGRETVRMGILSIDSGRALWVVRRGGRNVLEVRGGSSAGGPTTEVRLGRGYFDLLWPMTSGRRLEFTRHRGGWKGLEVEIDEHAGALAPLCTMRVPGAGNRTLRWPGAEVGGDIGYTDEMLALHGAPRPRRHGGLQVGAVPFLVIDGCVHVVLVTNSSGSRWIVPKGRMEAGMSTAQVALMEAAEEGGVVGTIEEGVAVACGISGGRRIQLHALRVTRLLPEWPERGFRKRLVAPIYRVRALIRDPALSQAVSQVCRLVAVGR